MLSGLEIDKRVKSGEIYISDYDISRLNPNSYNLRLHNELLIYTEGILDMKKENKTKKIIIPEEGLIIYPGKLYLGRTVEVTSTKGNLVANIDGRSSIARLGIQVHISAGFGDVDFSNNWTLEITCVKPVRIYPNVEICQIYYDEVTGDTSIKYNGKYQDTLEINASKLHEEF